MIFKKRPLETKRPPFRVTNLNTYPYVAFAWITKFQLVLK